MSLEKGAAGGEALAPFGLPLGLFQVGLCPPPLAAVGPGHELLLEALELPVVPGVQSRQQSPGPAEGGRPDERGEDQSGQGRASARVLAARGAGHCRQESQHSLHLLMDDIAFQAKTPSEALFFKKWLEANAVPLGEARFALNFGLLTATLLQCRQPSGYRRCLRYRNQAEERDDNFVQVYSSAGATVFYVSSEGMISQALQRITEAQKTVPSSRRLSQSSNQFREMQNKGESFHTQPESDSRLPNQPILVKQEEAEQMAPPQPDWQEETRSEPQHSEEPAFETQPADPSRQDSVQNMQQVRRKLMQQLRQVDQQIRQVSLPHLVQGKHWTLEERNRKIEEARRKDREREQRKAERLRLEQEEEEQAELERRQMRRQQCLGRIEQLSVNKSLREQRIRRENEALRRLKKEHEQKQRQEEPGGGQLCKASRSQWRRELAEHQQKYEELVRKQKERKPAFVRNEGIEGLEENKFIEQARVEFRQERKKTPPIQRQRSKLKRVQNYSELVKENFFVNMQIKRSEPEPVELPRLPLPEPARKQTVAEILGFHMKQKSAIKAQKSPPQKAAPRYRNYLRELPPCKAVQRSWSEEDDEETVLRRVRDIQFRARLKEGRTLQGSQEEACELYLQSIQGKLALMQK